MYLETLQYGSGPHVSAVGHGAVVPHVGRGRHPCGPVHRAPGGHAHHAGAGRADVTVSGRPLGRAGAGTSSWAVPGAGRRAGTWRTGWFIVTCEL